MPWRGPAYDGEFPSLGWDLLEWAEEYFRVPDGQLAGEPLRLTDEQTKIFVRWYQIDDRGKFVARRGALRRSQGWGKSPMLGIFALAELCGPVVFDGWDIAGEPIGRPPRTPWVQVAAVSEDQTENTYAALYTMASESELASTTLDVGITRVFLRGGTGRLEPVTSAAGTRLGQRVTFCVLDEALTLDTPLPTPSGWTTMASVKVGDYLLDSIGRPTRVVKKTTPEVRPCYRLEFQDHTTVDASAGHLWLTKKAGYPGKSVGIRTSEELALGRGRYQVPANRGTVGEEACLDIDPYILGYWLGDGGKHGAGITVGLEDLADVVELINARGYTTTVNPAKLGVYISVPGSYKGFRGSYPDGRRIRSPVRSLVARLRDANLLYNKHIPEEYLRASLAQRFELLCGLMDSDGSADKNGRCGFMNKNKRLIDQVAELVRSLGQMCTVTHKPEYRGGSGCWCVHFTVRHIDAPFRLKRKAERVVWHKHPDWISIKKITPIEPREVACVEVDAVDGLFLAGEGWHTTHNTHLWTRSNGGHRLAATIRRNAGKMGGRTFESTNAHEPGEDSVAERSYEAAKRGARGLLYDAVEAPWVEDLRDREAVIAALRVAYGDSKWVDLGRIADEIADPSTDPVDARRFYFSQLVSGSGRPVDIDQWKTLAHPEIEVRPGTYIGVGFDGSISDDSTVLYGCTQNGHIFEIAAWERPENAPDEWRIPRGEVNEKVHEVFARFRVGRMLCDSPKWWTEIEGWGNRYKDAQGKPRVLAFDTFSARRFAPACGRFSTASREGTRISHDGNDEGTDPLTLNLAACAKKKVRINDPDEEDDGRSQFVVVKADTRKIDRAVGAILAYEAAMTMPPREPAQIIDGRELLAETPTNKDRAPLSQEDEQWIREENYATSS